MINPVQPDYGQKIKNLADYNFQSLLQSQDDGVIVEQIKKDDPRVVEFQKRVAEKKKTQEPLPNMVDLIQPEKRGEEFGQTLAETKNGQSVLVGEFHDEADQWKAVTGIVEGYEKNRKTGDHRRIIFVNEVTNESRFWSGSRSWNETPISKRKRLGQHMLSAYHFKDVDEVIKYYHSEDTQKRVGYISATHIARFDAWDRISQLRPDINLYGIDTNNESGIKDGSDDDYDKKYADRDTAMAMNVDRLRKRYPDAIIIGRFGAAHIRERMAEEAPKKKTVTELGSNENHSMAKQLSALYDDANVHTINATPIGSSMRDSKQEIIYKPQYAFDMTIPINGYDEKKPWVNPWKNVLAKEIMPKPVLGIEDNEPSNNDAIIADQIRSDNLEVLEFKKRVKEALEKITQPLPEKNFYNYDKAPKEFGDILAKTSGGQFVMIGQNGNTTLQWNVLVDIVKNYEKSKDKSDARSIIFVVTEDPRSNYGAGTREWNNMSVAQRKRGTLGDHLIEAMHFSKKDYRQSLLETVRGNPVKKISANRSAAHSLPQMDALNELSRMRPDINIYAVGNNKMTANPLTKEFDTAYADYDTSVALNMQKLKERNPNTIIIGIFNPDLTTERNKDDPEKSDNIGKNGLNRNDHAAEQLSLINGGDNVHTIRVMPYGTNFSTNFADDFVFSDFNQFDRVVYVPRYNLADGWKSPW